MESTNKYTWPLFIILELALGIVLGSIFLKYAWNNDSDALWGKTVGEGIIRVYGLLSLILFFSVFLIGIVGAIKFKRSNKIGKAISYAIFFWLLSLLAYFLLAQFGSISELYIPLAGIIVGFNLGLRHNSKKEADESEVPD